MSVIISSNKKITIEVEEYYENYANRVYADGGRVIDKASVIDAITFALNSGVDINKIKVAVSLSWGVKEATSYLEKLYSLFDSEGDILFRSQDANYSYIERTYAFPTLRVIPTSFINREIQGRSVGVFDADSFTVACVAKARVYDGTITNKTSAGSVLANVRSEKEETYPAQVLEYLYETKGTIGNVAAWELSVKTHSTQGSNVKILSPNAGDWQTRSVYVAPKILKVFNGEQVDIDLTNFNEAYHARKSLRVSLLGYARKESSSVNNFAGSFSEAWCAFGSDEEFSSKLSVYLTAKYA